MVLKNVVLPAPFGPMRLTIAPCGILKSTLLTATRPPKRMVIACASSRYLPLDTGAMGVGEMAGVPEATWLISASSPHVRFYLLAFDGIVKLLPLGFAYVR